MPQSSLTAWLRKPSAVTATQPQAPPTDEKTTSEQRQLFEHKTRDVLPVPPSPFSDESVEKGEFSNLEHSEATIPAYLPSGVNAQSPLPPNVHFRRCTKADIPHFKRLNSLLLPIPYPESFYREIIEDPLTNDITLLATWHDNPSIASKQDEKGRLVGAIRCRLLAHPPGAKLVVGARKDKGDGKPMLYLSALVLLSPYRSHGIANHMLRLLTKQAVDDYGIGSVGAHVWEANAEGLVWYRKRGFVEVGREESYYRRLKPSGAVVMRKDVSVMDLMGR